MVGSPQLPGLRMAHLTISSLPVVVVEVEENSSLPEGGGGRGGNLLPPEVEVTGAGKLTGEHIQVSELYRNASVLKGGASILKRRRQHSETEAPAF